MSFRLVFTALLSFMLFGAALSVPGFAEGSHDRTQFGHDITVSPDEESSDVTCFGCSVRIRGHVTGDVTTFGGSVVVEDGGQIGGDLATFGGDVRLDKGAEVGGGLTLFGGKLRRETDSSVGGDVTTFTGGAWVVLVFALPLVVFAGFIAFIIWLVQKLTRRSVPAAA